MLLTSFGSLAANLRDSIELQEGGSKKIKQIGVLDIWDVTFLPKRNIIHRIWSSKL